MKTTLTEEDVKIYEDFMHYGNIIKVEDFPFKDDEIFITMKAFELDGEKRLFIVRNGALVYNKII